MNHELSAGILLGAASAAAANIGVVIEKLAIRRMPPLDARKTTAMVRRLLGNPVWVIGFVTIAAGLVMQVVALSLASISVVQAVAPTGTVLLLVLSHLFLGDRLRRSEYFGIAALVLALGLLVLSLDSTSDQATGSANLSALIAVTIPTLCASLSCFVVASRVRGSVQHRRRLQAPLYGLATGLLYGGAALDMKSMSTHIQGSGVVRAVSQIAVSPVFYLFLATSLLAFLMFQMALQRSITSVLVPVSSVLSTAFFILVGDALFHEHLPRAPLSLSLRLASFAMLGVGLLTLTVANEAEGAEAGAPPVPVPAAAERHRVEPEPVGRRAQRMTPGRAVPIGLFCVGLALLGLVLVVGPTNDLTIEWRQVVAVIVAVSALVVIAAYTMVSRQRAVRRDLDQTAGVALHNATEAHAARNRLETLLRAATGSAVMGVDRYGTINFFSAGAEQLLGYSAAEVVGVRSIADFIDPAQINERRQTIDAMGNALELLDADAAAAVPWTATRRDGRLRRCVVQVRAVPGAADEARLDPRANGKPGTPGVPGAVVAAPAELDDALAVSRGGYVFVAIDVTEREELKADRERFYALQKEATQSLIEQNNRLRELTQMKVDVVATVSHELRTPITSIRGFVEVLLDAPSELTESQVRMLKTIERNAEQLQRVAEDLLTDPGAGRGAKAAFSELDLARVASEAVDAMQVSADVAGVVMTMEPCHEEVPIVGDRTRLRQLLGNVLSNAIKYTPRYGRVRVAVDTSGDYARVQVMDEGPGIPAGERDQLFDRFYRLASSTEMGAPGAGLGLAIVKSVAEAHEGFVDITDTPGWSTTFRIFIPLRTPDAQSNGVARLAYAAGQAPD
jgi:PAS domain S-box-containing protein